MSAPNKVRPHLTGIPITGRQAAIEAISDAYRAGFMDGRFTKGGRNNGLVMYERWLSKREEWFLDRFEKQRELLAKHGLSLQKLDPEWEGGLNLGPEEEDADRLDNIG
jgi:hypothetical protein